MNNKRRKEEKKVVEMSEGGKRSVQNTNFPLKAWETCALIDWPWLLSSFFVYGNR